ncbi:sortase family protein [Methanobacterium lacus]|uniref:Sortase family protein n=1 Tax=Methanobacterium lacus (strain AL-21) TaxID=877455 RepID=F0T6K3_METLA|nr:class E sortase [Methanobacterium lacus]ADZ10637.1 sortase family protein [Methanobacterium lacus]
MKLSTLFVLIGIVIISLYCLIEVSYYSSSDNSSQNSTNTPYIEIPSINVDQAINNKSVDYGIYYDPQSAKPSFGTTALFGHRTFHGSPFLNLDKLKTGDNITVAWPGIGNVEYAVVNSTVVDDSYRLNIEQGNKLFLITCYPLGSDAQRLIIEANQVSIYPINNSQPHSTEPPYGIFIVVGFFVGGMILSFLYPIKDDQYIIFLVVVAITAFLVLAYLFPIPPDAIESQLSWFNNLLGV